MLRIQIGRRPEKLLYEAHKKRTPHGNQQDDQDHRPQPDTEPLIQAVHAQVIAVKKIAPDQEEIAKDQAANQKADNKYYRIDLSGCDRSRRSSRTVAADDHTNTE